MEQKARRTIRTRRAKRATVRQPSADQQANAKKKLSALGRKMAEYQQGIEELSMKVAECEVEARDLMKEVGMTFHETKYGTHGFVSPRGRSSSEVDVQAFMALLKKRMGAKKSQEIFQEVAKVNVGDVRDILPEKDAETVIKTTPAKPKPPVYTFTLIKQ